MTRNLFKIFFVLAASALLIKLVLLLMDESFDLKAFYYKLIDPVMKY